LLLLGVAMPLKYFAGMPQAVKVAGWLHGLLFMVFCMVLLEAHTSQKWPMRWSGLLLLAALLPFGPFLIDGRLKRADHDAAGDILRRPTVD
jgi:integral membrane protein